MTRSPMTCSLDLFAGRAAGTLNVWISENSSGIFLQDWSGSRTLTEHAKTEASIDCPHAFWQGKHTLKADHLLRALEHAPVLARPGMASSTDLLPLTVGGGSC